MPGSDRLVAAWRQRVDQDRAVAALILQSGEPLWDAACFHAQQAGEKALKTLLVFEDQPPPRTHDLVQLLNLVTSTHSSLADLVDACTLLTQYAVDRRYVTEPPSERGEPDAVRAVAAAERIWARVATILDMHSAA